MNRSILVSLLFVATAAALGAQEANQSSPYEGTSNPPPDDTIVTTTAAPATPKAKPPAGHWVYVEPGTPAASQPNSAVQAAPAATSAEPATNYASAGNDDGTVPVAPSQPKLTSRSSASDPDSDIVHPHAPRPGEIVVGTNIRVKLLQRLSTVSAEKGEAFRTRVATDVLQGGEVLIPAGAEIDGKVVEVSTGHVGGRGSMRLLPETVILPDGRRFQLHAEITGTPGSKTHVVGEGTIEPNSRIKRDGVEYGGGVGAGVVTGAIVGGPVGAVTGGAIGAGLITAHLLVSHPQATLEPGTTLMFMLTEPLQMDATGASGN
jgi:hypothetical protein